MGTKEKESQGRPLLGRRTEVPRFLSGFVNDEIRYPYSIDDVNKRSRRHNDGQEGEGRLLSQSAFSRISETLGALNTVGNFLVNFTRGEQFNQMTHPGLHTSNPNRLDHLDAESLENERPMQLISTSASSSSSDNSVPDAILTLTKNVLGQNMTKTIEPFIKRRISMNNKQGEKHELITINHNIDIDEMTEKKRKKHQTDDSKIELPTVATVSPGNLNVLLYTRNC